MALVKRYLLFAGYIDLNNDTEKGGWENFIDAFTSEDAAMKKWKNTEYDWFQVVDSAKLELVSSGDREEDEDEDEKEDDENF